MNKLFAGWLKMETVFAAMSCARDSVQLVVASAARSSVAVLHGLEIIRLVLGMLASFLSFFFFRGVQGIKE